MSLSRRDRTVLLLCSRLSHVDGIRTGTGSIVARQSKRGEGPSEDVKCNRCDGDGTLPYGKKRRKCERCDGKGKITVDAYTEQPVGTVETGTVGGDFESRKVRREIADRELAWLELRLDEDWSDVAGDEFTNAVERGERLYASGSYRELDLALEALREHEPLAAHAVMLRYVYSAALDSSRRTNGSSEPIRFRKVDDTSALARLAEWGISFIVLRMPEQIRVPGTVETDASIAFKQRQERRNAA